MKIGRLNAPAMGVGCNMTYTRAGGRIPMPPKTDESGTLCWPWQEHHATVIEVHFDFTEDVFLTALTLNFAENAPESARLLRADGACIGTATPTQDTLMLTLAERGKHFVLQITPTLRDLDISDLALYGAVDNEPALYPTPAAVAWGEGSREATVWA